MARRSKRKKPPGRYLGPLDTFIDLAGAVAMGAYVKHKVKTDYAKGNGESSARAAAMMFGAKSLGSGTSGMTGER